MCCCMPTGQGRDLLITEAIVRSARSARIVTAAGHVLKLILLSKAGELLRAILWAIVTHHGHWKSMSSNYRL